MNEMERREETKKLPKTFMSPAYVEEKDPGIFAMYRDILIEEGGVKEKFGKRIGPMYLFRIAKKGEKEDFMTSRPDGEVIMLVRTWPPKEDVLDMTGP
jgi:hypothetical protein